MRQLVVGLVVIVLAAACSGDDGADSASSSTVSTTAVTTTSIERGPIVGPTTSTTVNPNCQLAADAYVEAAATLFEDRPEDSVVDDLRARFEQLDFAANADGCGDAYRVAVCDGLDELTRSGTLVVYQMLTAQCI